MVTKYSGRTGTVGGRTKLVLTYSPTSVKHGTSSVKVTAKLYWDSKYRTQDSHNTVKMTGSLGSWTGSSSFNGTSKLLHTMTKTVSTSYTGTKRITVNGYISGVEASPGSHKVTAAITIPKRPVAKPAKPTNVTMDLLSDGRTKTSWSSSPTTAKPVTSYTVQYRRLDGSTWTGWKHSATVKGKSYTSNAGSNNHSYQRRVRANNAAGSSPWVTSNYVRMKPYTLKNVKARVKSSGSDIEITWDYKNPAETSVFKLQLQRKVNDGSWENVSKSFGQVKSKPYTSSYTDDDPGNGSNKYRIRIVNNGEDDDSAWAKSNTVSTIVPPKAPDHLDPDGSVVDFTQSVKFTWDHHDDGDGADQSHYELRYREADDDDWETIEDVSSSTSEHKFEGGELENGVDYEWQVRTQGNTKEGFGPWSSTAFITGWTAPVVAIEDGTPPNPLTALPVPLSWTYSQDEGKSQIEWQARLYALGSGDVFDSILEEKGSESSSTSTEFSTALEDGERYGIMVRARSSKGQWSEWSETTFDVELLVPADLHVDVEYDPDTGQMNLHVTSEEPVDEETAETVSIDVERRINGDEWIPILLNIPFDAETSLVDNIPSIWGVNEYRVTATTEAPSKGVFGPFRKTVNNERGNTEMWTFLNYGETFDEMLRMQGDLSLGGTYDRSKETQKLLGRKKPISLLGEQLSREHSVSGTALFSEPCEVEAMPDDPVQLVGSPFFDDIKSWDESDIEGGSNSRRTADAHYRGKTYGYLIDVPDGNGDDLVSPSPRSGVPGTEVPGSDVEEVLATNLWRGSKLSENGISVFGKSGTADWEKVDDGLKLTSVEDPSDGAYSYLYTSSAYRQEVEPGKIYSWSIPVRNEGETTFPLRITTWLANAESGTDDGLAITHDLAPGETYVAKMEGLEASDNPKDIRFSLYYGSSSDKPPKGSTVTILDGITLVEGGEAASPFNGDGTIGEVVRTNYNRISVTDDIEGMYTSGKTDVETGEDYLTITFTEDVDDEEVILRPKSGNGFDAPEPGDEFKARIGIENTTDDDITLAMGLVRSEASLPYKATTTEKTFGPGEYAEITSADYSVTEDWDQVRVGLWHTDDMEKISEGSTIRVYPGWTLERGDSSPSLFNYETETRGNTVYREGPDRITYEIDMGEGYGSSYYLYRWDDDEGDSQSEKYSPAGPGGFDEYEDHLSVKPDKNYEIEAYISAPDMEFKSRRNLTSQGDFPSDRRLWGSESVENTIVGTRWTKDSEFESGAVRLREYVTGHGNLPTPYAKLGDKVKASTLGINELAGQEFTFGIDVYSNGEDADGDISVEVKFFDSDNSLIGDTFKESIQPKADEIERIVARFEPPEDTDNMRINIKSKSEAAETFWSYATLEDEDTDGTWIEPDYEGVSKWTGAENIDEARLMVQTFDRSGDSLSDPESVAEISSDEFSSRWRTLRGEYPTSSDDRQMRVWVEWSVNGDHEDDQSDWYFGGMKITEEYSVTERWPGPDANPDEWRAAQYDSTTVCLRTPSGHRVFGAMSGLDMTAVENNLNAAEVSFDVTETDYTENPLVLEDDDDVWDPGELDPYTDSDEGGGMVDVDIQPGVQS